MSPWLPWVSLANLAFSALFWALGLTFILGWMAVLGWFVAFCWAMEARAR